MSNYSDDNFCSQDDGLDYIFTKMSAIFGATFTRHFDGVESSIVRETWKEQIGGFLTYKPSMDFALDHLNSEFIPSAIKFRELCNSGPSIPLRGVVQIEHNPTPVDPEELKRVREEGLRKLKELRSTFKGKF